MQALPGDPVMVMLSDHSSDVEMATRLRSRIRPRPAASPFSSETMSLNALTGDFGLSFRQVHTKVRDVIWDGLLISPVLALAAIAVAFPLGTFAGIVAATRRNTVGRYRSSSLFLVAGLSIPNFAVATFLVYIFSIKLAILPVAGWGTIQRHPADCHSRDPECGLYRAAGAHLHA